MTNREILIISMWSQYYLKNNEKVTLQSSLYDQFATLRGLFCLATNLVTKQPLT